MNKFPAFLASLVLSLVIFGSLVSGEDNIKNDRRFWYPREGDILIFGVPDKFPKKQLVEGRNIIGTGGTQEHVAIVVKMDGKLKLLEARGARGGSKVQFSDIERIFDEPAKMWVRRIKKTLNEAQSKRLTEFAIRQEGKPYSVKKAIGLLGACPTGVQPQSSEDPCEWFCSELIAAACKEANLMTKFVIPVNVDPEDFFSDDRNFNISRRWEPPQAVNNRRPVTPKPKKGLINLFK